MRKNILLTLILLSFSFYTSLAANHQRVRQIIDFTGDWQFKLADSLADYSSPDLQTHWRVLNLPHDWSIESDFSDKYAATPGGGALPGGIGWYRKTFTVNKADAGKAIFVDFDGVYWQSSVWVNGHLLGFRPNGYISFRYNMTPYLKFGEKNVIVVKVDNSNQPNSRWYSGSGIYRNVRMVVTNPIHVALWGTYVTTPKISQESATINIQTAIDNPSNKGEVTVLNTLYNAQGKEVTRISNKLQLIGSVQPPCQQTITVNTPHLWSISKPYLYTLRTTIIKNGATIDDYETTVGIRSFVFDVDKGLILNGKQIKIQGVCDHHDLGCLGTAINERALQRQLQLLKSMGCNAIRCSHNPPSPELLNLCDRMGFIVMDEAFDMWREQKSPHDYSHFFDKWFERDLTDLVVRDRNHPSVFMWSIGNEILEQWTHAGTEGLSLKDAQILLNQKKAIDSTDVYSKTGRFNELLTIRLANIVKALDPTRPVSSACNEPSPSNHLIHSGALDLIGINYHPQSYGDAKSNYPNKFVYGSETVSSVMTRGNYITPSDSIYLWPERWDKPFHREINQCSAYDNTHVPWGCTHEEGLIAMKKMNNIAGQFVWTGFDYLGEPTPFWWPSRSSYFGIIDLAGFPKDVYYLYQSQWTDKTVLHIFPHWNWTKGTIVDIWAYYNHADEVELFLNGKSLGIRKKQGDKMHVVWRIPFEPGTLKAVSRKDGKVVMTSIIKTAGEPVQIRLTTDRSTIKANGKDLAFVTVEALDKDGNAVPIANNMIKFTTGGNGFIAGTDNGDPTDALSLKKPMRKLFNGKAIVVLQSNKQAGVLTLTASAEGLRASSIQIKMK